MATIEAPVRPELLGASDAVIEDALIFADPMVLRGLIYQLTGDPELANLDTKMMMTGFYESAVPASDAEVALLRRKAADFLKS